MQDKALVIAIVVVLGICCLGIYVAVSGFLNSNPTALPNLPGVTQLTPVVITISTPTNVPTNVPVIIPTAIAATPTVSPLGVFPTFPIVTATVPVAVPPTSAPRPAAATATPVGLALPACGNSPFCPRAGSPDSGLGPGGNECPRNYIWGRVADASGKGLRDRRIRFINPTNETDAVTTKAPPDPEGAYNIPTGQLGSTWIVWLLDPSGGEASPRVTITTQAYSGVGNCPTRIDFVQR